MSDNKSERSRGRRRASLWNGFTSGDQKPMRFEGTDTDPDFSGENGGYMETIDGNDFEKRVEASSTPVLLCFSSPDCKPCRLMADDVAELEEEYRDAVVFLTVDTSRDVKLAVRLNVVSTPTLILFVDGAPALRMVGYVTKHDIKHKIDNQLEISSR